MFPRHTLLAVTLLLRATTAAAGTDLAVNLDPQRLAGDLLLVSMATEGPLVPLAAPARAVFDFLAAAPPGGTLRARIHDDSAWLQWRVDGDPARNIRIPPELGRLLARIVDFTAREAALNEHPVATPELIAAFAADHQSVAAMFTATLAERPLGGPAEGGYTWFERGGLVLVQTTSAGPRAVLFEVPDGVHQLAHELRAAGTDRAELAVVRASAPVRYLALDPNGLLVASLERQQGKPETAASRRLLLRVIETLFINVASSSGYDRSGLLAGLAGAELPAGRLAGRWHSHPGYPAGEPPSPDDSEVAATHGRFLTIRFRREGYDIYDLRAGRSVPGASPHPDLEARPPGWAERFATVVATSTAEQREGKP